MSGASPLLAACLIVRDESSTIVGCLESLKNVVDEIIVYDTGSADDTAVVAGAAGATVIQGYWNADFARARNDALAHCTADWVLSIDADEVLCADSSGLRAALAQASVTSFLVAIDQQPGADGDGGYRSHQQKLFRRARFSWTGKVHERLVAADGAPTPAAMPAELLSLSHSGYSDTARRVAKARRNAAIGLEELRVLNEATIPDPDVLSRVLLDLGRSLVGCDQRQGAADAFAAVRGLNLPHADPRWLEATEGLTRLALGAGQDDKARELVVQLREAGAPQSYCDYLDAQAMTQLGDAESALVLLRAMHELVDSVGRSYDVGQLIEMRALVAAVAGHVDEAVSCLAEAMARYGRIAGRGELLLTWWGDRPVELLWQSLGRYGDAHVDDVRAELDLRRAA